MKRWLILDLARGLAALGVMLFHLTVTTHEHIDPSVPVFGAGTWGVPVFFVISGFCIMASVRRGR